MNKALGAALNVFLDVPSSPPEDDAMPARRPAPAARAASTARAARTSDRPRAVAMGSLAATCLFFAGCASHTVLDGTRTPASSGETVVVVEVVYINNSGGRAPRPAAGPAPRTNPGAYRHVRDDRPMAHTPPARTAANTSNKSGPSRAKAAPAPQAVSRRTVRIPRGDLRGDEVVLPYSTARIFRGFGRCKADGTYYHPAIDVGGVGPDGGLGTPVRSMARARVKFIGRPTDDAGEFGAPDTRGGMTTRGGRKLPRSKVVAGYGRVNFFTATKGRWRSGTVIVTEGLAGPLNHHVIRYMHLGAVLPGLRVGDILQPGQELGLMGGTGVQQSSPHVHIDMTDAYGRRVDVAPFLGLPATQRSCPNAQRLRVWQQRLARRGCETVEIEEDFGSGRYDAHAYSLDAVAGRTYEVSLRRTKGSYKPRIWLQDEDGNPLYDSGRVFGTRGPITSRRLASGQKTRYAKARFTANRDRVVNVQVTAWPKRGKVKMPDSAKYRLTIKTTKGCRLR